MFTVSYVPLPRCLLSGVMMKRAGARYGGAGAVVSALIVYHIKKISGKEGHRQCHRRTPLVLHRSTTPKLFNDTWHARQSRQETATNVHHWYYTVGPRRRSFNNICHARRSRQETATDVRDWYYTGPRHRSFNDIWHAR